MAGFKTGRMAEDIKREIAAKMRELKDPRLTNSGMLTVVRVDLSSDGSHCKVYISSIEGLDKAKQACRGLDSASGIIKRAVSNKLGLKKCPEMQFIADNSAEHSIEINRLLDSVITAEKGTEDGSEGGNGEED